MTIAAEVDAAEITDVDGYLGLSPEQRYNVASQHFPPWLLLEPIEFPSHHSTYGWGCRVDRCEGASTKANTQHLCDGHRRQLFVVQDSTSMEEFLQGAEPVQAHRYGWAIDSPVAGLTAPCLVMVSPGDHGFGAAVENPADPVGQSGGKHLAAS